MPVQTISCVVGNTYNPIAPRRAKKSRKGVKKTHDIQIFVDIIDGNEDAIEKVYFFLGPTFDPQEFICTTPVRTKTKNGTPVSRFATRQQVTGSFSATIKIRGSGGSSLLVPHSVLLNRKSEYTAHSKVPLIFKEPKPIRPFKMIKVPSMARFGIELELSSAMHLQAINVANQLANGTTAIKFIQNYREGRATIDQWKIVPDGSLACNRTEPDCNKFELVSPPLIGGEGLCNISRILTKMGNIQPNLKVNKSMGFHVHIDVSALTTSQLIKICQQFVKYEDVIDSFMPASRRSGSTESKQYFQSNRASVGEQICFDGHGTNRQIHDALQKCDNNEELSNLMNKSGRYYKLNMQNLINGRQPSEYSTSSGRNLSVGKMNQPMRRRYSDLIRPKYPPIIFKCHPPTHEHYILFSNP